MISMVLFMPELGSIHQCCQRRPHDRVLAIARMGDEGGEAKKSDCVKVEKHVPDVFHNTLHLYLPLGPMDITGSGICVHRFRPGMI